MTYRKKIFSGISQSLKTFGVKHRNLEWLLSLDDIILPLMKVILRWIFVFWNCITIKDNEKTLFNVHDSAYFRNGKRFYSHKNFSGQSEIVYRCNAHFSL